jgi:hypothetical protein
MAASKIGELIDDIGETGLRAITGDEFVDALKADRATNLWPGVEPYAGPESALNITPRAKQELSDVLRQKGRFFKRVEEAVERRIIGYFHKADLPQAPRGVVDAEKIQSTIEAIKTRLSEYQKRPSFRYQLERSDILDDDFFNFDISAGAARVEERKLFLASPEWKAVEEADRQRKIVFNASPIETLGPHYPSYVSGDTSNLSNTYREILIQKPPPPLERPRTAAEKKIDRELDVLITNFSQFDAVDTDDAFAEIMQKYPDYTPPLSPAGYEPYKSHNWDFGDVGYDDIVVHIRTRDIKDAEGNKVLFVEEIQSDWHQEGRVQGYSAEENRALREKFDNQMRALDEEVKKVTDAWTYSFVEKTDGFPPTKKLFVEIDGTDFQKVSIPADVIGQAGRAAGSSGDYARQAVRNMFMGARPASGFNSFFRSLEEAGVDPSVLQLRDRAQAITRKQRAVVRGPLPDAPFKKTWPNVAVKRLLHLAAEEGYSSIAFTKGDVIHELVGGGLSGQEYFYNKVLPKVISKEAKKVNATVEVVSSPIGGKALTGGLDFGTTKNADIARSLEEGVVTIKLSPESKKIAEKGRPLFQKRIEDGVEVEKSSVSFMEDGRAVIRAMEQPDFSSLVHEIGHIIRRDMEPDELDEYMLWLTGEPHKLKVLAWSAPTR